MEFYVECSHGLFDLACKHNNPELESFKLESTYCFMLIPKTGIVYAKNGTFPWCVVTAGEQILLGPGTWAFSATMSAPCTTPPYDIIKKPPTYGNFKIYNV